MATGRRWLLLATAIAGAFPAVLIGAARADSTTVTLQGFQFVPKTVQVFTGDTVTWKYVSGNPHTVTFEGGPDLNPQCPGLLVNDCLDRPGRSVGRTFSEPGTYAYYCKNHGGPGGQGMSGVVKVTAAAGVPGGSTTTTGPGSSSTTATTKPKTTSTTAATTTTTRPLATSSTLVRSTTTTFLGSTTTLTPGAAPSFDPGGGQAGGQAAGGPKAAGRDSTTVAVIIALLLAVATGGGLLLWRLRPSRSA